MDTTGTLPKARPKPLVSINVPRPHPAVVAVLALLLLALSATALDHRAEQRGFDRGYVDGWSAKAAQDLKPLFEDITAPGIEGEPTNGCPSKVMRYNHEAGHGSAQGLWRYGLPTQIDSGLYCGD